MHPTASPRLPTHGFVGVTHRVEVAGAFGLVLLHAIDVRSPKVSLLSWDLMGGTALPKDFVAESLYAFFLWICLSLACSVIDSLRLLARCGGLAAVRAVAALFGSKSAWAVLLMIVWQCAQGDDLHPFFSCIHPYLPNFALLATLILFLLLFRPPTVLLLGSSSQGMVSLLRRAKRAMRGLRCVALLDTRRVRIPHLALMPTDNLRTFEFVDWERKVQGLMDHVALIVVDGRTGSEVVEKELSWILGSEWRASKAILVATDEGEVRLSKDLVSRAGIRQATLQDLPLAAWGPGP